MASGSRSSNGIEIVLVDDRFEEKTIDLIGEYMYSAGGSLWEDFSIYNPPVSNTRILCIPPLATSYHNYHIDY